MKILFYLHRFPAVGGIENVTVFLANAFSAEKHQILIVSHFGLAPGASSCLTCEHIDTRFMPEAKFYSTRNRRFLQDGIKQFKPDVIIYQDSYAPIERNLFVKGMNVPVVVCEHNSPYVCYDEANLECGRARRLLEKIAFPVVKLLKYRRDAGRRRFLYECSWRYVLLSDRFRGEFRAVTRLNDYKKLRVIANATVGMVQNEMPKKQNELLFVGTLNRRKGCDLLVDFWLRTFEQSKGWTLVVVGDGPLRVQMEERFRNGGCTTVRFEGRQKDVARYYKRAKVFVFPSRREGLPLVLLEACAYGCVPVVFDSYSSVRDVVSDSNGVIVPAYDLDLFVQKVIWLMSHPDELSTLGEKCSTHDEFQPATILKKWQALFEELNVVAGKSAR